MALTDNERKYLIPRNVVYQMGEIYKVDDLGNIYVLFGDELVGYLWYSKIYEHGGYRYNISSKHPDENLIEPYIINTYEGYSPFYNMYLKNKGDVIDQSTHSVYIMRILEELHLSEYDAPDLITQPIILE